MKTEHFYVITTENLDHLFFYMQVSVVKNVQQ